MEWLFSSVCSISWRQSTSPCSLLGYSEATTYSTIRVWRLWWTGRNTIH